MYEKRSARNFPEASSASSLVLATSRPCSSDRKTSERLHRVADHARVLEGELDDAVGRAERGLGRGLVARDPVEGEVSGKLGVELRGAGRERLVRRGHGGQVAVFDRDQLGRVLRELRRFGDNAGDALADMAHLS